MNDTKLGEKELRELYRADYVSKYPSRDNGRLSQQLKYVSLGAEDRAIDFACGNGLLLDLIHDRIREYVGIDFSSEFIEDAEARRQTRGIANGVFVSGDIIEFCESHPEEFEVAFASDFAEHIYDEDFIRIFSAMRKALKPGGRLYTHTPNGGFLLERLKSAGALPQPAEHIAIRNANEMKDLLEKCGYSEIQGHRLPHYRWLLAAAHPLSWIPGCREIFSARLLFGCKRSATK